MNGTHPLRAWRAKNDITLETLAKRVGVKPSHISQIECDIKRPSLKLAVKLSRETADESGKPQVSTRDLDRERVA